MANTGPINRSNEHNTLHRRLSTMTDVGEQPTRPSPRGPKAVEPSPRAEPLQNAKNAHSPEVLSSSTSQASVSPSDPVFSTPLQSARGSSQPSLSPAGNCPDETNTTSQRESVGRMRCMFTENCDTGAQLRKAISHFFGRNKSCTLKIPPQVWVYYCRKHYQRIRYRNSKDYGLIQIDLVKTQVEMLQSWSQKNQESGHGRHIRDWALALRKREQERVEELGPHDTSGASSTPQWVFDSLGSGYTSEQVLGIVDRFKSELLDKTIEEIPEIEFLPDIVGGDDEGKNKNSKPRKQNKRKASQISSFQEIVCPEGSDAAVSLSWENSAMESHQRKRARLDQPSPRFLHGRSLNPPDSIRSPPRPYADPGHKTSFGEHSGFKDQTLPSRNLHQAQDYAGPIFQRIDPVLLNSTAHSLPGRAMDRSSTRVLDNTSLGARNLQQRHAGPQSNETRHDPFDKLPPLTSYRANGTAGLDRQLPPISGRYDGFTFNAQAVPNKQPQFSDGNFSHEYHASIYDRCPGAGNSGTTIHGWPNANGLGSQSLGGSSPGSSQSFLQPPRASYQVHLPSSQAPQVARYGFCDQNFGNDDLQAGRSYHLSTQTRYTGDHHQDYKQPSQSYSSESGQNNGDDQGDGMGQ